MSEQRVKIVGRHPHTGEWGTLISRLPPGHLAGPMYRIALEDCQHGTQGCFADAANIRPKPLDEMIGTCCTKRKLQMLRAREEREMASRRGYSRVSRAQVQP